MSAWLHATGGAPEASASITLRGIDVVLPGDVRALRDVSFEVRAGELVGLLGPNGAGKSTAARVAAGLVPPLRGEALARGRPIASLRRKELARLVAHLAQEVPADLPFTAAEVVLMGRTPHLGPMGLDGPGDRERVSAALEEVDALPLADRPIASLSGGERRRVLVARVLVQDAPIWILDEPTAHLDLAHQHLVLRLARRHAARGGAVLCVLHDLAQAAELCDRVVLLRDGAIAAAGRPDEVLVPATLSPIFGVPFFSAVHPETGAPLLLPSLRLR